MVIVKKAIENEIEIKKISKLLDDLSINYNEISYYILAFIHRSIVNERPDFAPQHNERLEFLGDAVLELVITDNLYSDYPEKTEGELTDIRSAIVRGRNLSQVAKDLNFSQYLLLGKGEEKGGGRNSDYLLANVTESLIGAIYKDLGWGEAKTFIDKYVYPSVKQIVKFNLLKDFKTSVQEYAQAYFDITPTYEVLSEEGLDHEKNFKVGIYFGETKMGEGEGSSKKRAQEKAAENAYLELIKK